MKFSQFQYEKLIKLYREYDLQQKKWLDNHADIQPVCRPACIHCCNMSVKASLIEAVLINHDVCEKTRMSMCLQGAKHLQFAQSWTGDEDAYFFNFRKNLNRCPLLNQDGYCLIHPIRPFSCRSLLSGISAEFCRYDIADKIAEEQLNRETGKLDPKVFQGTPYMIPLFELAEPFESKVGKMMENIWGISVWGELNFLIYLINDPVFSTLICSAKKGNLISFFNINPFSEFLLNI